MAGRADEFRRQAQDCLAAAVMLKDEEARAILINIAGTWQRLAEQEDSGPPLSAPGGADQPAMQQQQQVQPKDEDKG
jgi:hypothetical protein